MAKLDIDYLTLEQAALLYPLHKEIKWVQDNIPSCGPLHIVAEDGNYKDDDIDFCIKTIEEDGHWDKNISDHNMVRMLDIAKALKHLSESHREMVCEGCCVTDDTFQLIEQTKQYLHNLLGDD